MSHVHLRSIFVHPLNPEPDHVLPTQPFPVFLLCSLPLPHTPQKTSDPQAKRVGHRSVLQQNFPSAGRIRLFRRSICTDPVGRSQDVRRTDPVIRSGKGEGLRAERCEMGCVELEERLRQGSSLPAGVADQHSVDRGRSLALRMENRLQSDGFTSQGTSSRQRPGRARASPWEVDVVMPASGR